MVANGYAQDGVFNREERFDTVIQIALHHVGASQVDLRVPVIAKVEDAAVLQETPYHTSHTNIVTDARKTRAQAAYATYKQVNTYPRLLGTIEQTNDLRVDGRIHFEDQASIA